MSKQAAFYGLDVYSFFESMSAAVQLLEKINPFVARKVRARYSCFDPFFRDEKAYARALFQNPEGCEREVIEALSEAMRARVSKLEKNDALLFDAQQNARVAKNAEKYYRAMIHADEHSWNVRDRHMMETLSLLLERHGPRAKGIVWAHNTHIGDYRATDMLRAGMVNLGGLARTILGDDEVALIGFSTFQGQVIASHSWDGPTQVLEVPQARRGSFEAIFHEVCEGIKAPAFVLSDLSEPDLSPLSERRGHRAIGVVYDPAHEGRGNYVPTSLTRRYDAFIHIDKTRALDPIIQPADLEELPETWPVGY